MTKEEIIQAISGDKMMPFIQPGQLAEIVDFVLDNYKPSLPSDLDEAAKETAKGLYLDRYNLIWMFKAGAKWMAGQGIKIHTSSEAISEYTLIKVWAALWSLSHSGCKEMVVQIREK